MKVHVVYESLMKGNGVYTAFTEMVELLKEKDDVEVLVKGNKAANVFHSHTYGLYYFWKGRKYKGRRVYTVHVIPDSIKGSLPHGERYMPLAKWYFKKVYEYADVCIAISPMVENAIKELGAKTRVELISNPIIIENWKRTPEMRIKGRKMLGLSNNDFVVLGVGQLEGRKGIDDFIDVSELVTEAKFVWAGGRPFGLLTEGINRINEKISTANHIKLTGMVELEKMKYIYAAADLLLFPSYQENCPLAPLEAAASGMPVIFRNLKEYSLLYGLDYLRASTVSGFAELIERLMTDNSFYEYGLTQSEQLVALFDKNKIREKLINLYRELNND